MTVIRHRSVIPYHSHCEPLLKIVGLYQMSQMANMNIDPALLASLVERWRPETHTFHLPVGEMTVTLQDVSCLWALPIQGIPVTGVSDSNWSGLVDECLGVGAASEVLKRKKRSGPDAEVVYSISGYAISLTRLRNRFAAMPNGPGEPTEDQVLQYTRAYILDMFGSMIFTDSSGDSVPAMYLQFLRYFDPNVQYNWGAAVLSVLYRNLCAAVQRKTKTIAGPMVLLQQWCWSRLPTGRPRPLNNWAPRWGFPDPHSCPAFGEKWCCHKDYRQAHGRAGVSYFRGPLQDLEDYMVEWEPYRLLLPRLPSRVHLDEDVWRARMPLIHFWIVEHHYPDRVMRQFGLAQAIPPPLPLPEYEVRRLHRVVHSLGRSNWSDEHQVYVNESYDPSRWLVVPTGVWMSEHIGPYRRWFQENCMYTVFLGAQYLQGIENPIPPPRDEVGEIGYIPSGPKHTRDVSLFYLSLFNLFRR